MAEWHTPPLLPMLFPDSWTFKIAADATVRLIDSPTTAAATAAMKDRIDRMVLKFRDARRDEAARARSIAHLPGEPARPVAAARPPRTDLPGSPGAAVSQRDPPRGRASACLHHGVWLRRISPSTPADL